MPGHVTDVIRIQCLVHAHLQSANNAACQRKGDSDDQQTSISALPRWIYRLPFGHLHNDITAEKRFLEILTCNTKTHRSWYIANGSGSMDASPRCTLAICAHDPTVLTNHKGSELVDSATFRLFELPTFSVTLLGFRTKAFLFGVALEGCWMTIS